MGTDSWITRAVPRHYHAGVNLEESHELSIMRVISTILNLNRIREYAQEPDLSDQVYYHHHHQASNE